MSGEVVCNSATVTRECRERLNGHKSVVVWFTGLSGSGKSTLAHAVEEVLHRQGCRTFVLDGDNVRRGLCADLGFSPEDRRENLRRIAEMARLFLEAGVITLAAFISPMCADRERVKKIVGAENFLEVYVRCPVEVCEARDVKGMYRRARTGQIRDFTGISAPYEPPEAPALVVDTDRNDLAECVEQVLRILSGIDGLLPNSAIGD